MASLDKSKATFRQGSVLGLLNWVGRNDMEEPALLIVPANRNRGGVYALCLSSLFKYVQPDGYPNVQACMEMAFKAKEVLGFDPEDKAVTKDIIDLVVYAAPDLVSMPPTKAMFDAEKHQFVGEMAVKIDGETVMEREVYGSD